MTVDASVLPARFWAKVNKGGECWLWTAACTRQGYGRFSIGTRLIYAHRVAYELTTGPIPDGMELDHLCRVRGCVNPAHLEPVTHAENVRRAAALVTHCPRGHALAGDNLESRKDGRRNCRTCGNARRRESRGA